MQRTHTRTILIKLNLAEFSFQVERGIIYPYRTFSNVIYSVMCIGIPSLYVGKELSSELLFKYFLGTFSIITLNGLVKYLLTDTRSMLV